MNTLLNGLKANDNKTYTENGAKSYRSTMSGLCDMFALGGAYRTRSVEDCVTLFNKAYEDDPVYAMKCLFYLRDVRGGQGERRFFREVVRWIACWGDREALRRNIQHFPEYGRVDDLYCLMDTPLEEDALNLLKHYVAEAIQVYKSNEK